MRKLVIKLIYAFILILTIALAGIFIIPFAVWHEEPEIPLKVWIIDKTVPAPDYREHKGLMWLLNHSKVINEKTSSYFRYEEDYYGYFPGNNGEYQTRSIPTEAENPDLIYLVDTYGVYTDDYVQTKTAGIQPELIYGGLSNEEINSIFANIGSGNTVIGEFNIASAPTNNLSRQKLGKVFGIDWLGWKGRYFKTLDKNVEVPEWVLESYEKQYGQEWRFTGSGFILISDDERIIVLETGRHVLENGLKVSFDAEYKAEFAVEGELFYQYWFEILQEKPGREVLAYYKLSMTEEGGKILAGLGLENQFPAIIRNNSAQYTAYYLAGDFADLENVVVFWNLSWLDKIKGYTVSLTKKGEEYPDYFYWKCYVPFMKKVIADVKNRDIQFTAAASKDNKTSNMLVRTKENGFAVYRDGRWENMFIKGVNIGAALPGKWFTEFPEREEVYLDWFEKIGQMNANSIRTYTLLPPEFYQALAYYNKNHGESPLWLFQEIWPEENPREHNYLAEDYEESYLKEIEYAVDAMHGRANIPERVGRAYGIYTADVSPYIAGYLVGRELEPEEVMATNTLNKGYSFKGDYLQSGASASPAEGWLAMNCDYVLKYEESTYGWQHPVAIVSWPTLDPQRHDSEWNVSGNKMLEYNDKVAININNIETGLKMQAGFFGAYHIYPNYPDFMNNEQKYDSYRDEQGRFRYGGYLQEFMKLHTKYPALVAEFGLATGMGNAHMSPDGYNHGGMTEKEQGDGITRMMKAMLREDYAGGLVFEWQDEWAKKTWITEPFMIPYDRHANWHNVADPEQNYGLLAQESVPPAETEYLAAGTGGLLKEIALKHDAAYLYIDIRLGRSLKPGTENLLIGLDTYSRENGEFRYSPLLDTFSATGMEFMITLEEEGKSRILVHPGYNISKNRFSSYASENGTYEEIITLINGSRITKQGKKIAAIYNNDSELFYGDFRNNSRNHWYIKEDVVHIRIPWGRLNISDPSSLQVIDDNSGIPNPLKDQLKTTATEGIIVSSVVYEQKNRKVLDKLETTTPFVWEGWNVPRYQERLKESYYIVKDYFASLD